VCLFWQNRFGVTPSYYLQTAFVRRFSNANSASHESPRGKWIKIPVPALLIKESYVLAQKRLTNNKLKGPCRIIETSILQSLVHCRHCGYALYRSSTQSSTRKICFYCCSGSDAYLHAGKALYGVRLKVRFNLKARYWVGCAERTFATTMVTCGAHSAPYPNKKNRTFNHTPLYDQYPIREKLLDQLVCAEILRLLEDSTYLQIELNR